MKRIGITQRVDVIEGRNERRDALDQRWGELLRALGAVVVPLANRETLAAAYVNDLALDGVIFSGGNDPVGSPGANPAETAPERDALERALFGLGLQRGLPILGVCRGAQMINLLAGGKLSRVSGHVAVRHEIRLKQAFLDWPSAFEVNSFHGLGILAGDLASGSETLALAPFDGSVEAFRMPGRKVAGILWHPEREAELADWDRSLFRELFGIG